MQQFDAVIVGGGQAGLAVSHELSDLGVEHVVLERHRIAETWRGRWDSFCLVTPNWSVQLPGFPYNGDDPDGFMLRDEIVEYLEGYATAGDLPVREGVGVRSVERTGNGEFLIEADSETLRARHVIVATGAYQRPFRPESASTLPPNLLQMDVHAYRNASSLPPESVLIIGSGQSGCQLAEELHEAGHRVVLACGKAPWCPRRVGDHDIVWWMMESGFMDATPDSLPSPAARLGANPQATGHGGGHDLHYRTLHDLGVTLTGRFLGASGNSACFASDLPESVAWGDGVCTQIMGLVQETAAERGLDRPSIEPPSPWTETGPQELDLTDFGTVIFATGFRPGYGSWLPWPDAFDGFGFPMHREGSSTVVPGLHFVGVHFLRKRKSSLLCGVGEDAAIVARTVSAQH